MSKEFGRLLTEAVYIIRARTGKPIKTIHDELGYAIGRNGGSCIEYWRSGHIPSKIDDLYNLIEALKVDEDTRKRMLKLYGIK